MLVKCAIQNAVVDSVAEQLARLRLDAKALKLLTGYLDASPPGPDFAAVLRMEQKGFLEWYIQAVRDGDLAAIQRLLDELHGSPEETPPDWKQWIPAGKATPDTARQFSRQLEELDASYARLIDAAGLPPSEFEVRASAEAKKLAEARNPFSAFTQLPAVLASARYVSARAETRLLMLRAAVAVVQVGPEKLKDFKDPYGSGPFEYRILESGFELKSQFLYEGKPVTLTVGGGWAVNQRDGSAGSTGNSS
jgi:hypothetical protein